MKRGASSGSGSCVCPVGSSAPARTLAFFCHRPKGFNGDIQDLRKHRPRGWRHAIYSPLPVTDLRFTAWLVQSDLQKQCDLAEGQPAILACLPQVRSNFEIHPHGATACSVWAWSPRAAKAHCANEYRGSLAPSSHRSTVTTLISVPRSAIAAASWTGFQFLASMPSRSWSLKLLIADSSLLLPPSVESLHNSVASVNNFVESFLLVLKHSIRC